jgi:SAM-dependent methyltransferase
MTGNLIPTQLNVRYGSQQAEPQSPPKPRVLYEACPLCAATKIEFLREADCSGRPLYNPIVPRIMKWMRCGDCEHVFTDGIFSPEVCAVIFGKTHENQRPGSDFERQRFVSARMVEKVARHVKSGAWLDVGFGNGSLLFTAAEWGFSPVGLDLRHSSVEVMRELGVEAHCVDLNEFESSTKFTVISMADVLEHMPFPREALVSAKRLLRPDGLLFLSMPNYACMVWRLLDAANANPYWHELEHYHNFSRARLFALLDQEGFDPIHYSVSERYRACMEVLARPKSRDA